MMHTEEKEVQIIMADNITLPLIKFQFLSIHHKTEKNRKK
jgi:hypothetical protein